MSNRPRRLVVGDVSLTMGLVMNPHDEGAEAEDDAAAVDHYDHATAVPATADGLVVPGDVSGLQVLQHDMRARVPGPALDGAVQAAFVQLVPPGLREAIHMLAEWDARWFVDCNRPSIYSDAHAAPSHGDRLFETASADAVQPLPGPAGSEPLPPLAETLRRHAWTVGPLRLAGGHWAGAIVHLTHRDPASGLYGRVAHVALVDPRRDIRHAAEAGRALRRLEHALGQAGLVFGEDGTVPRPGQPAWTRTAWRRTIWVPRQADADDGSCGPRYYVLARTLFARLTALWERQGGSSQQEAPYEEALWSTPLSGWFDHEATRWEMVGHHAARAVRDAHYQARVTAEVVPTQHGGRDPARAALQPPPAPAYEAAPAPLVSSLFAPEVWPPSASGVRPAALMTTTPSTPAAATSLFAPEMMPSVLGRRAVRRATTTPSINTTGTTTTSLGAAVANVTPAQALSAEPTLPSSGSNSLADPATTGQKRRRLASGAAPIKRRRVQANDNPAPPNGYPVYPKRPLDPWDWRCVRWALEDPFEARWLLMHAIHWREEAEARARWEARGRGGGFGGRGDASDDSDDDGNGASHGHGHGGEGAHAGSDDNHGCGSEAFHDGRRDGTGSAQGNSSGEDLDIDARMRALVQQAARATGESAEMFLARHQLEAIERERAQARARGVGMQAPERPSVRDREPKPQQSQQQKQGKEKQVHDRESKPPQQGKGKEGKKEDRRPPLAYMDETGKKRINLDNMELYVARLMGGE